MYAAPAPCSAGAHVAWSSQSNGGSAEREPTHRPVLPRQAFDDAASGLAGPAQHQRRRLVGVFSHIALLLFPKGHANERHHDEQALRER
jgi:hypothetical protein